MVLLQKEGYEVSGYLKSKYVSVDGCKDGGIRQVEESLGTWAAREIPHTDYVIFIGAVGIAVRTMVPFIKSKRTDPAVVVLDEKGQFVISLLSGHLGGANELTSMIAEEIHAIPVITTATDVNHHFAVDVFAKKKQLWISNMRLAKEVSALVLHERVLSAGVGVGYEKGKLPVVSELAIGRQDSPDGKRGTFWIQVSEKEILHLVPQNMVLGIGCRKDTPVEKIESLVRRVLEEEGICPRAVACVCSIDLKKEEPGLVEFAKRWEIPLRTYTGEELRGVVGDFTPSAFVSQITGVDNVCERSACLGSGQGILVIKKHAQDGVTVACAVREWSVKDE